MWLWWIACAAPVPVEAPMVDTGEELPEPSPLPEPTPEPAPPADVEVGE
jgi:hypothetical protein